MAQAAAILEAFQVPTSKSKPSGEASELVN
jgi:hypothetical protein